MYFCPKCKSLLNITKTINNPTYFKINNLDELITSIQNDNLYGIIEINFIEKDLINNKKIKKLDNKLQNKIINTYNQSKLYKNIPTYFICNYCNYHKSIIPGTIMYTKSLCNRYKDNSKLLIDSLINDNTLPRTKDFICPNKECTTSNMNIDREAIFYRPYSGDYDVNYICCTCKTEWKS